MFCLRAASHILTFSHSHTLTLSHSHFSHSHTLTFSHSHTLTLAHLHTCTLAHLHTSSLPHFLTPSLPHFLTHHFLTSPFIRTFTSLPCACWRVSHVKIVSLCVSKLVRISNKPYRRRILVSKLPTSPPLFSTLIAGLRLRGRSPAIKRCGSEEGWWFQGGGAWHNLLQFYIVNYFAL